MSFPLAFPAGVVPKRVTVGQIVAQPMRRNPYSLRPQVVDRGGRLWTVAIQFQTSARADAAVIIPFLIDLQGRVGTFTLNLDAYVPGLDPAPGLVTFRPDNPPSWDVELQTVFECMLTATQEPA